MVGIKSKFLLASGVMVALAILLEHSLAAGDIDGAQIAVDGSKSSEDDEISSRLDHLSLTRIRISADDLALRLKCSLYETSFRTMLGEKANSDVTELFNQVISALSKIKIPFGYKNPFVRVLKKCSDITKAGEGTLKSTDAKIAHEPIGKTELKLDPVEDEISAEQQSTDESPEVEGETQDVTTKPTDAEIAHEPIGDTSILSTSDSPQELLLESNGGDNKQIGETEVKLDPAENVIRVEEQSNLPIISGVKAKSNTKGPFNRVMNALGKIKLPFSRSSKNLSGTTKAGEGTLKSTDAKIAHEPIGKTEVKLDPVEDEISAEQQSTDESPEVEGETQDVTTKPTDAEIAHELIGKTEVKLDQVEDEISAEQQSTDESPEVEGETQDVTTKPADAEVADQPIGDTSTLSTSDSPQELLLDSEEGAKKQIGETEVKLDPVEDEISAEQKSNDEKPEVKDKTQPITATITPSPTHDLLKSKTRDKSTKKTNKKGNLATSSFRRPGNKSCRVYNNMYGDVEFNYGSSIMNNQHCNIHYNDKSRIWNNQGSTIRNNLNCRIINCHDCIIYNNTGIEVINQSGVVITGRRK